MCIRDRHIQLNDLELDPLKIRAILINEAVPCDPSQDFYGRQDAAYLSTTIPLFQKAGFKVQSIQDILQLGIYITNAVKTPKTEYAIARSTIEDSLPYLEKEDVYKRQGNGSRAAEIPVNLERRMGVPEIGIGGSGEQGTQVGIGIFRILQNGKYVGDPGTAPAGVPASVFQPVLQGYPAGLRQLFISCKQL